MMSRTTMTRSAMLAGAGFVSMLAAPAIAGLPEVLDHVPAGATAVVVVDNINEFDQHFSQFIGAIEMPMMTTPKLMLNQLGIGQNINMDGSAALVVLSVDIEDEDGEFVFLAPTNNFNNLVGAFNAKDAGGGIMSFDVENDTVFAKQVGEWAAMSDDKNTLAGFSGKAGNLGVFKENFGAAGLEMADTSDLFIAVNPAHLSPIVDEMQKEFEQNAAMMPGGDQIEAQMEMAKELMESFVRDGSSLGFGVSFGAMGVSGNSAIAFKPGTEGHKMFRKGGDSGSLMSKLPNGPFLFAFAMDNSAPMAKSTMAWLEQSGMMEMNEAMGMGMFDMSDMDEYMSGAAGAAYPSSAGIMGGLLANMITFSASDNPGKLKSVLKGKYEGMSMDNDQLGMSITSSYTPNETQINGKSADGWAINMNFGGMNGGMGFNPMQMIFGSPNGPNGYIVEANGGLYQSFSRASTMLAPAINGSSSITDDRAMTAVGKNLPEGRYAEFYLGVRPILEQVVPFMGMMGVPPIDLPQQMPPVGFGLAARDGGAVGGMFVPAQTIKSAVEIAMTVQGMGMGGGGGGDWGEEDDGPGF